MLPALPGARANSVNDALTHADALPPVPRPGPATAADPHPTDLAIALARTISAIHARGWCDGTGGNFSCVRQREPLELLMAPSGVDKGSVSPGDLIVVDGHAQRIEGEGRASAETPLHLEIVRRTGAGSVLHTHSQAATLLSRLALAQPAGSRPSDGPGSPVRPEPILVQPRVAMLEFEGLEMLKGLEGVSSHECRIVVPVLANDQDLNRLSGAASPHLAEAPHGLLIGGHGLYAWGRDLFSARRHLDILEFLLEQRWRELLLDGAAGRGHEGRRAIPPGQPREPPRNALDALTQGPVDAR